MYCEDRPSGIERDAFLQCGRDRSVPARFVMTVTEEEYRLLQAWSDVRLYLPRVEDLKEESGSQVSMPPSGKPKKRWT